jgi:hypothetical protein
VPQRSRSRSLLRILPSALVLSFGGAELLAQGGTNIGARARTAASATVPETRRTVHAARARAVCDTAWSVPRELLTADGKRVYVEVPTMLPRSRGLTLIGSPTVGWMTRTNFIDTMVSVRPIDPRTSVGVSLDSHGVATPLPPIQSTDQPLSMLAASDRGSLRIVWATSRDTSIARFGRLDAIWTSMLRGGRWSSPVPLASAPAVRWYKNTAAIIETKRGPAVLVPLLDTSRAPQGGLLLLHRTGDRWTRRWIGTGGFPPTASNMASLDARSVVMAVMGDITVGAKPSIYGLFVARSALRDTGRTELRLLRRLSDVHGSEPKFFLQGDSLRLAWLERGRSAAGVTTLLEVSSADAGETWTPPIETPLEGAFQGLTVLAGRGRGAFAAMMGQTGNVAVLARGSSGWTLEHTVGPAQSSPTLAFGRDELMLTFGVARTTAEIPYPAPVLMVSSRPLRCRVAQPPPLPR